MAWAMVPAANLDSALSLAGAAHTAGLAMSFHLAAAPPPSAAATAAPAAAAVSAGVAAAGAGWFPRQGLEPLESRCTPAQPLCHCPDQLMAGQLPLLLVPAPTPGLELLLRLLLSGHHSVVCP